MSYLDDDSVKWGRRLLTVVTEQEDVEAWPVVLVIGLAATVSLVVLVVLCICGESGDAELKNVQTKVSSNNVRQDVQDVPEDLESGTVQIRPKTTTPESNGLTVDSNNVQQARQSQTSTTSSQMRPTSLRELPELPTSSATVGNNEPQSRTSEISNDDYDHLWKKPPTVRPENYDHITLGSPSTTEISEASPSDPTSESHYAQVSDRTYEHCNGSAEVKPPKKENNQIEPPYNKIRDDPEETSYSGQSVEPPYNTVKDDPTYNHFKDNSSFNNVQDDYPYNDIPDDPYSVPREEGAAAVVTDGHYELEPLDPEDPYTVVDNEEAKVEVVSMNMVPSFSNSSEPFKTLGNVSITDELMPLINAGFSVANIDNVTTDCDYAVVNKGRNPVTNNPPESDQESASAFPCPPEPPRGYRAEEATNAAPPVLTSMPSSGEVLEEDSLPLQESDSVPESSSLVYNEVEKKYSKVSARESLASMSARNALNPYEDVVETENTYATVDGGSGDGVVTMAAPAPPSSPLPSMNSRPSGNQPTNSRPGNPPTSERLINNPPINNRSVKNQPVSNKPVPRQPISNGSVSNQPIGNRRINFLPMKSNHFSSETYAEIGQSGGAANSVPHVPVPPSLDSLHSMKKHEKRHLATPEDTTLDENTSNSVSPKRTSFSPTTALPGIPSTMSSSQHENDITLDPDYQRVKDSIDDNESENDPNYESVEEARSKFPPQSKPRRGHVYEEVSPTNSEPTSPENVRERVLNRHTYEDIVDVKEQKKNLKGKPKSGKK